MITVYGEGRGFRVVWMLEEMRLPYRLRPVDLSMDPGADAEFLRINPSGFIPALVDGDVTMVESIAILEYLGTRYGPTPLRPDAGDRDYPAYLQFLLMGEAGMADPMFFYLNAQQLPEDQRDNPTAAHTLAQFRSRTSLVRRRLSEVPYLAGERFTAADISVAFALNLAERHAGVALDNELKPYLDRVRQREGYRRAIDACPSLGPIYRRFGDRGADEPD